MHSGEDVAQRGRGRAVVSGRWQGRAGRSVGRRGRGRATSLLTTVHGDATAHAQLRGGAVAMPLVPG
jgi:hypothetical protein